MQALVHQIEEIVSREKGFVAEMPLETFLKTDPETQLREADNLVACQVRRERGRRESWKEGGRDGGRREGGGRERGREEGELEGGREGWREKGGREGRREGGREGGRRESWKEGGRWVSEGVTMISGDL